MPNEMHCEVVAGRRWVTAWLSPLRWGQALIVLAVVGVLGACGEADGGATAGSSAPETPAADAGGPHSETVAAPADDYASVWGPAVGSQIPLLAVNDHLGQPQTLETLAGERGLLLVFSRSADW